MGKRGTKPTPTKILAMRGSWRANRRPQEPTPPSASPRAPAWLDAEGKKVWRTWWKRLEACGILTQADEVAFARYCQTLARWIKMELFLQKNGEVYPLRDVTGRVTGMAIFPQVGLYLRLGDQLQRLEASFGLTPASRATLSVSSETPAHGNSQAHKDKSRFFAVS